MTLLQASVRESPFIRSLVCSRVTDDGRITLSGSQLTTTVAGTRRTAELATDAEVLDAYKLHFGITLDRLPEPPDRPDQPEQRKQPE